MESQLRSLLKTLTYRVAAVIGTWILLWLITRDIKETTFLTLVVHLLLTIIYYVHERIWNKISWGYEKNNKK